VSCVCLCVFVCVCVCLCVSCVCLCVFVCVPIGYVFTIRFIIRYLHRWQHCFRECEIWKKKVLFTLCLCTVHCDTIVRETIQYSVVDILSRIQIQLCYDCCPRILVTLCYKHNNDDAP
jgi:hypothetical protein